MRKKSEQHPTESDVEHVDKLAYWMNVVNRSNGYAGIFGYRSQEDKKIVEKSVVTEWGDSVAIKFGIAVEDVKQNPNDPPDFFVLIDGCWLGTELTQLVEEDHKRRAAQGESPYAGKLFDDMQWSRERLTEKLEEIIHEKGEKYLERGIEIEILLIHTAEPWLASSQAQEWLDESHNASHPSIANVFLMFDHEPLTEHWPILRLYGNLGAR